MASHTPGRSDGAGSGSSDFESGLDYGAFVEDDDAQPTQALPRTTEEHGAQRTLAFDRDELAAAAAGAGTGAGRSGAGSRAAGAAHGVAGEDITASRPAPAPAPSLASPWGADRYPSDATVPASAPVAAAAADTRTPEERARLPKAGPRLAQVLLAVLAPLVLLLGAVRLVATPLFLWLEYHRPGFPADPYGFSTADRMTYGSAGLDYLHNLAGPRYLSELTFQGKPLLSEAAVSHMTDVKTVMWIATAVLVLLGLACLLLALYLRRTSPGGVRRALFAGALGLLVVIVVLAAMAATGWQGFFAGFHSLFFAEGTWTFSVSDPLIRLYPAQFWVDAAVAVAVLALIGIIAALVAGAPTRRRREMSQDRRAQLEATRLRWAREDAHGVR